ncbi:MAG: class I SAM-dependent methyltransferase, partial [Candidatus Atribacteria bacterium]|nr:class I SAM-dependent methyltransferase [Candidatus Atribacteria bacterium]
FMEYWHDWRIIYRSKEDFLRMVPGLSDAEAEVQFDKTGIQMLLHISKRGADG